MNLRVAAVAWIASTLASSCNAEEQIHRHGEEQLRRRELTERWLNETQGFFLGADATAGECKGEGEECSDPDYECECECLPGEPFNPFPFEPTPLTPSDIEDVIWESAIYGGTEFADQDSYQSQALAWLSEGSPDASTYSREKLIQRYAMACIYYSTSSVRTVATDAFLGMGVTPDGWDRANGWLSSADVCGWYGLTCDSESRVTAIELGDNYLTGRFPREVTLVNESLVNLSLKENPVFNDGDFYNEFLGELPALRFLQLQATSFRYTSGLPPQMAKLTNLVEMDISNTVYRGPIDGTIFENMPFLEYLDLSKNEYGSPVPIEIGQLPSLKYFYAVDSGLTGDLSFMAPMPIIKDLWVDLNPNLSGGIPSFIGEKTTLTSLGLSAIGFSGELPASMGLLVNMERLWLYTNAFNGSIPAEFGGMSKLKLLKVHGNDIGGKMRQSVCNLRQGPLMELTSDCLSEVNCTCCTECF